MGSILRLLDQMPAGDPPADLVDRTMQRIDGAYREAPAAPLHPGVQVDPRHLS